jgi:prolyl-tRNA synthetase
MVGALIMVHGDDNGLKIPPKIAPIQVVIIPINAKKEKQQEFSDYINNISDALSNINIRSKVDDSDGSPGFKFNKWELKGVPIRLEVGLKEFESSQITLCRRDNKEKQQLSFDSLKEVQEILVSIQSNMFNDAKSFMEENTCTAEDFNTFSEILSSDNKFIKAYWDGSDETELKIKDETKATIRCILEDVDDNTKKCIYSNKPAKHLVIFAKAY